MPAAAYNPVFAVGTKASYQAYDATGVLTGTAATFLNLRGIGAGSKTRTIADVTSIQDTNIKRRPAKRDPGTVSLTLGLTDVTKATNEWTVLEKYWNDGTMLQIAIDLPGTFDDAGTAPTSSAMYTFDGFISSISTPEISAGSDEMLTYTVEIQRTAF
jgi:hypothetical protein